MNPADVAQAAPVAHDMSLFGLFWQAHFVVKLVMVGLLGASIWCWAIIVDKSMLYGRARRETDTRPVLALASGLRCGRDPRCLPTCSP